MLKCTAVFVTLCLALSVASPVQQVPQGSDDGWRGRIAGGTDAEEGQFPYQVSLRTLVNNMHFCGGAVLNNRWIVTAASCAAGKQPSGIAVLAGTKSLSRGGTLHQVDRIVIHPNFEQMTLANDVAVMRVRSPFVLSNSVMAVQMANEYVSIAYGALVSGWGRRAIDSPAFPDWLQFIPTNIITNTECRARFEAPYNGRITDNVICTSSPVGRGACLGDAGGPLVHGGELQGIVSWGIPCGTGMPDVFSRVPNHRAWVMVHTMV